MADIFGEYTGLYFYSAVFQGNLALLALSGIFAIFVLQKYYEKLSVNGRRLIYFMQPKCDKLYWIGRMFKNKLGDAEALLKEIRKVQEAGSDEFNENEKKHSDYLGARNNVQGYDHNDEFKAIISDREIVMANISKIKSDMKSPFEWTLGVIIASLILLAFANNIHKCYGIVELIAILAVIAVNIVALVKNKNFVFNVLKH